MNLALEFDNHNPSSIIKWWVLIWGLLTYTTITHQGVLRAVQLVASNIVTIAIFPLLVDTLREKSVVREWVLTGLVYAVNAVKHRMQSQSSLSLLQRYAQEARRLYLLLKQTETDSYYLGGSDVDLTDAQTAFMSAVDGLMYAVNLQGLI
jgi:hypothetical protein